MKQLLICLVIVALTHAASAQAPTLKLVKIPVKYVRAGDVLELLCGQSWRDILEERYSPVIHPNVPSGIETVVAYDAENSIIVRGTEEAIAELTKRIAAIDLDSPRVRLTVRIMPTMRSGTGKSWRGIDASLLKRIALIRSRDLIMVNHTWETFTIAPYPFPIRRQSRWDTNTQETGFGVFAHVESDNSVSLRCGIGYCDSQGQGAFESKRVDRIAPDKTISLDFALGDPKLPVASYRIEITARVVEEAKER